MSAVCIIPARGGSRRIPRKNIRMFHGKPILAYSVETAKESKLFDKIVVSTDDADIAEVATKYGADIHWRDADSARDEVGTHEVAARVLEDLWIDSGIACVLYPCAPLITADDLMRGYRCLGLDKWFSMSVGTDPLCDAGAFYFGDVFAFADRFPLIGPNTSMVPIPKNRVCDINTMSDWIRAEHMYEALRSAE